MAKSEKWYKQLGGYIVALISVLVGLLVFESKRRKDAELKAHTIETTLKDENIQGSIESKRETIKALEEAVKRKEASKEEESQDLSKKTAKEIEEFYKNRLK